ncbi:ABC transporter ATPase [Flavobacteriaceae bacterium]|nr:ABC transporter ATPase [Flavobacteriaceae bacterium]MDA7797571.1 ABC transporter ATPase [Flavobacteriaceae bacterium]MDA9015759.1 ABC transporter ATPase [Flavobacteriaceae bacterium]MDB3861996.1 ABC transporter ATPase [Flavobacteriaceae bacterium]
MIVPFEKLTPESRVWIYPSNRPFREGEIEPLKEALTAFLSGWTAHNQELEASFDLPYNRFIILGLNQEKTHASGCSIDASVHFIQKLEQQLDLVLLDKMNVTFKQGDYLSHKSLEDFKKMAKEKAINKSTIVFNNLVDTVEAYQNFWEVPAEESWHSRFF